MRLSLFMFTFCKSNPFHFPTYICRGVNNTIINKIIIPGQPNLLTRIADIPTRANGITKDPKRMVDFDYNALRSLESIFMIFPISWLFAVNWEILDSLLNMMNISKLRIFPLTIGIS